MRRIKSCPAEICTMSHTYKTKISNKPIPTIVTSVKENLNNKPAILTSAKLEPENIVEDCVYASEGCLVDAMTDNYVISDADAPLWTVLISHIIRKDNLDLSFKEFFTRLIIRICISVGIKHCSPIIDISLQHALHTIQHLPLYLSHIEGF